MTSVFFDEVVGSACLHFNQTENQPNDEAHSFKPNIPDPAVLQIIEEAYLISKSLYLNQNIPF